MPTMLWGLVWGGGVLKRKGKGKPLPFSVCKFVRGLLFWDGNPQKQKKLKKIQIHPSLGEKSAEIWRQQPRSGDPQISLKF